MRKALLLGLLAFILAIGNDAFAARTTRDLVFEDDEAPAASGQQAENGDKQKIGVKTTVMLTRDGNTTTVAPSYEFKSGDKVKLAFTPSIDGYVYWLAKGTSGNYTMLYPSPQAGADNAVKRNVEYTVPAKGAFRFDDTPGNEELLCILSASRLEDLDKAAAEQFKSAGKEVAELEASNAKKRTTRDLVFEEDEEEDVSTKTQEAQAGEPFVAGYTLSHK